ncbi:MAG: hypothetical protein AAFQ45_13845 [Pseudomonadota bacterium]
MRFIGFSGRDRDPARARRNAVLGVGKFGEFLIIAVVLVPLIGALPGTTFNGVPVAPYALSWFDAAMLVQLTLFLAFGFVYCWRNAQAAGLASQAALRLLGRAFLRGVGGGLQLAIAFLLLMILSAFPPFGWRVAWFCYGVVGLVLTGWWTHIKLVDWYERQL